MNTLLRAPNKTRLRLRSLLRFAVYFSLGVWAQASGLLSGLLVYWEDLPWLIGQHIALIGLALFLATISGSVLAISLSTQFRKHNPYRLLDGIERLLAIPYLALLSCVLLLLDKGPVTAVCGLWLIALAPIIRYVYTGLQALPDTLLEAAHGIGLSNRQTLFRVALPNAAIEIIEGIRIAAIVLSGLAPLAYPLGGGGLGSLLLPGLEQGNFILLLAGALPAALLAILIDLALGGLGRWLTPIGLKPYSH